MLLKGQRHFTLNQVDTMAKALKLTNKEQLYLQTLVQLSRVEAQKEKEKLYKTLENLSPKLNRVREIDFYEFIRSIIHNQILAICKVWPISKAEDVQMYLRRPQELQEIQEAMERLVSLGLLHLDQETNVFKVTYHTVSSPNDIPNKVLRQHHVEAMEEAKYSLEHDDVLEREFQAMTMTIPEEKMELAKKLIREFRRDFEQKLESESADSVYQLAIQFYPITKNISF